jgi:hypothetical protein
MASFFVLEDVEVDIMMLMLRVSRKTPNSTELGIDFQFHQEEWALTAQYQYHWESGVDHQMRSIHHL